MMADPLSLAVDLVRELVSRVNEVKINHAGCQLLSSLARQTLEILQRVQETGYDTTAWMALEHMQSALQEAHEAVDKCINTDFLSALLYHESFAAALKQAADKLKHALDEVPLASVSATADLQTDVEKLTKLIEGSSFVDKAEAAQKGRVLKEELEKAFHTTGEGSAQVQILIKDLLKGNASSKDDLKGQLDMLKKEATQAKNEKGSQTDFELTEIINAVTESIDDADELPAFALHVKDQIRCPLSREVMQDPVVLLESGVTYDRSSITQWIEAGNLRDPIKNTELKTAELMPNTALRDFCMAFFEEYGGPVLDPDERQRGVPVSWIQAGMYEGRGKLDIGSSTILIFQMLILEPHGQAIGYTIYKPEVTNDDDKSLDIGGGEWDGNALQISYGDKKYSYEGSVTLDDNIREPGMEWKGRISISGNASEEYDFVCYYSPPPIAYEIWPRLGILQIEDAVTTKESLARYSSKVMLSLESDAVIDGWMWFKSSTAKAKAAGRIIGGKWKSDGYLWFKVYFPPKDIPLNSDTNPTNHFISLEIQGKINQGRGRLPASFVSKVLKIEKNGDWPSEKIPSISLDTLESLEYPCVREASTPWHYINPDPLRVFRVSRNYELESVGYSITVKFDVNYGFMPYYLREWKRTPLHIASRNNTVDIARELIEDGANVNDQDINGESSLHLAAERNCIDIVKELIAHEANIDVQCNDGNTPLHVASRSNSVAVVEKLIACGANINIQNVDGETPLHIVTTSNFFDLVKEFIGSRANINLKEKNGLTPLHIAVREGFTDTFQALVKKGAVLSAKDKRGWAPLHTTASRGQLSIVKLLLERRALKTVKNNDGQTPYDIICTDEAFGPYEEDTIAQLKTLLEV